MKGNEETSLSIDEQTAGTGRGKRISRRQFLIKSALGTAAILAGGVLTSCIPPVSTIQKTDNETPVTQVKKESQPQTSSRPTTWPIGSMPRNRTLVYAYGSVPAGVHGVYPLDYNHQAGNALLYEPAAYYSVHADKTYLWLAESYQYNADATRIKVIFRKGIKWSDGTPFSARDAAWSMETLKRVPGLNGSSIYKEELDRTEVVNDTMLNIYLKRPDYRFFFKSLTFRFDLGTDTAIQPAHIYSKMKDDQLINERFFDVEKGWPVSTGPYGVSESNDQQSFFDLRPTWWAVESGFVSEYPDVWRVLVQFMTGETTDAEKMINKEVDQSADMGPIVCKHLLEQAGDYIQTWTSKPPYGYIDWWPISIQFCTKKYPFDNSKVRWAIAYAINQQEVVDIGYAGASKVANSPFPEYKKLNEYMTGIKDITDKYNVLEYNLDKSAALMVEAGFTKDEEGFWVDKNGARPDSNLYSPDLFFNIAPVIVEQLLKAGFDCAHKNPPDVWMAMGDGRASMFPFGHGGGTIDPYDTFLLYYSDPQPMGYQSPLNITRWKNPEFVAITDEMSKIAPDDPKMKDLFRKGMEIYYRELPDCPLVQWFHRIPVNTTYWENWPTAENPYMNSALWHLTASIVVLNLKATLA